MRADIHRLSDRIDGLLSMLEAATVQDKAAENRKQTYGCLAGLLFLVSFFSLFLIGVSRLAILASVPLFLAFVTAIIMAARSARHDLDNRKLGSAIRLIKVLQADIGSAERVHLMIDFRDYRKNGALLSKEGRWNTPRRYVYEQRWLSLRARFADGNVCAVSLVDRVRRREKPKRKRTKITERVSTRIRLILRLDKRYADAQSIAARLQSSPPPSPLVCAPAEARGRSLRVMSRTPIALRAPSDTSAADAILRLLRFAYRGISADRRTA